MPSKFLIAVLMISVIASQTGKSRNVHIHNITFLSQIPTIDIPMSHEPSLP